MGLSKGAALNVTVEIVKAGLANGAIKLQGSSATNEGARSQGEADALYLQALLEGVQKALMEVETTA